MSSRLHCSASSIPAPLSAADPALTRRRPEQTIPRHARTPPLTPLMPRFPLVRALIALLVAFICFSWTTPALAQDAGGAVIQVPGAFADGGVPKDPSRTQPGANADAAAVGNG